MASYTGLQKSLISKAGAYAALGYRIGYARNKEFLVEYKPPPTTMGWWGVVATGEIEAPDDFNGISLIPDGIVCVDLDEPDFGLIWEGPLPPTWKERTPRGWHLFYNVPIAEMVHDRAYYTKIKWRPHVDLLIKDTASPVKNKRRSIYGGMKEDGSPWGEHVIISPTTGYQRVWPEDAAPAKSNLTMAPQWLVDALEKTP